MRRTLITNSSLQSSSGDGPDAVSALLFPDCTFYPKIWGDRARFIREVLHSSKPLESGCDIESVTVLICGHGGRDQRCGVLGPLLEQEFRRLLGNVGLLAHDLEVSTSLREDSVEKVRVALVSHLGGHKWAGNVIIYFPPKHPVGDRLSPLAGRGIWYGRVEPKHVEGIINETIRGGKVIGELFRGATEPPAVENKDVS